VKKTKPPESMSVSLADIIVACHVLFGDAGDKDETYAAKGNRIRAALPTTWHVLMDLCQKGNVKYAADRDWETKYQRIATEVKAQFEEATK
jgi:hypothetical protein